MGTNFYWFYDLLLIGLVIVFTFKAFKKGFVSTVLGMFALLISFSLAMAFSGKASEFIYDSFMSEKVEDYLSEYIPDIGKENIFSYFSEIETEKITLDGKAVSDVNIKFDPMGKTVLDLKNVNLENTGIEDLYFSKLGIDLPDKYKENVNLGKIVLNLGDMEKYELKDLIFAKALVNIFSDTEYGKTISGVGKLISNYMQTTEITDSNAAIYALTALVNSEKNTVYETVTGEIVKPFILKILKSVFFFLIFSVASFLLLRMAGLFKGVNLIPIVGPINSFLGGIIGFVQALILIFAVVILLHIFTVLTGNTILFLNEPTINNSILFKYIYNYQFLNFNN